MPPTQVVATAAERYITTPPASISVSRRENLGLESLRSKKQRLSFLDVKGKPPSSLPSIVIARGHKRRNPSPCTTSQTDCMASTSTSLVEPIADASEQRPRKRHKRSSSTPAAPRPSQLSTRLQSRRRCCSRAGSPATDMEYVLPSRASARLARKIHPFIHSRSTDIYAHLADPDGAGNLLSEPPAGSVILSTPNELVDSQSVKQPRGRRKRIVDLTNENAKKDLMEEWARLRQSQGTLPLSGIDENACLKQMLSRDTRRADKLVSSMQLEAISQGNTSNPDPVRDETTTTISTPRSQETALDASARAPLPTQADSENAAVTAKRPGHKGSVLPSDGGTERPVTPSVDLEASLTSFPDPHTDEGSPSNKLIGVPEAAHHDSPQYPRSSLPTYCVSTSQEDSVHIRHTEVVTLPVNEQAEAVSLNYPPKDSHSVTSQTSFDNSSIYLDSDEGFHMLDIPEIFTLPWVPVASHLYVPPGLGKLISGMREQLTMETRARRRAEELHEAELSRRISAEKTIEGLRTMLEEKQKDLSSC